jgi:hypothetical protein
VWDGGRVVIRLQSDAARKRGEVYRGFWANVADPNDALSDVKRAQVRRVVNVVAAIFFVAGLIGLGLAVAFGAAWLAAGGITCVVVSAAVVSNRP